jgi:hypothetical protein
MRSASKRRSVAERRRREACRARRATLQRERAYRRARSLVSAGQIERGELAAEAASFGRKL